MTRLQSDQSLRDRWIEKPQAAVTQVVSVSDDIRLELDLVGAQAD
jgi:hypothetical protein